MPTTEQYLAGKPAFPGDKRRGLTLKQHIAIQVLPAIIQICAGDDEASKNPVQYFAKLAMAQADALIREFARDVDEDN